MKGKFVYWKSDKDGQWYFHLKAPGGEIIADSEGYTEKHNCLKGIDSVKRWAPDADVEEKEN